MTEEIKPSDLFDSLGITEEDIKESDRRQKIRGRTDQRVCMCGHGMSKHKFVTDVALWSCRPNAYSCPCKVPVAVMEVSNIKPFLRKTIGGGLLHALFAGLQGMRELDKESTFKPLIPWECAFCATTVNVQPQPLTKEGYRINDGISLGYDRFVCEECRIKT